jgi:hypothetical protein
MTAKAKAPSASARRPLGRGGFQSHASPGKRFWKATCVPERGLNEAAASPGCTSVLMGVVTRWVGLVGRVGATSEEALGFGRAVEMR